MSETTMNREEFRKMVAQTIENLKRISSHIGVTFEPNSGLFVTQSLLSRARVNLQQILEACEKHDSEEPCLSEKSR